MYDKKTHIRSILCRNLIRMRVLLLLVQFVAFKNEVIAQIPNPVNIQINFNKTIGEIKPIWAFWGYDEPNYTYMKDGKKLLSEISALSPVPVYVRTHSLLVTGEGTYGLKWGSTNAYTEDENGNPVYDWTVVDRIFDTYIERGMKPIAQIGFMPKALSVKPEPYRHYWKPGDNYGDIFTGWAYPPNDYKKWAELIYQWVLHSVKRYGKEEVETWYWELWNEPDIPYWKGTTEEYLKLYDYTADAVKRALPSALIGGPETTSPRHDRSSKFLKTFLNHVTNGTNYVTGQKGSPIDFLTFHAKGKPEVIDGVVTMDMSVQMQDISSGFEIIRSFPKLKDLPIIIGESDPEGCAACPEFQYPPNAYRNGTMYSSYTAASFARKYQLADYWGVNLAGAVTWGFEFENQPWFAGFREMSTNGVDKPVLNVFRMFGMMSGKRVEVAQNGLAYTFLKIKEGSVRGELPDINAIASIDKNSACIMVWNYHDVNDLKLPDSPVTLYLNGIPNSKLLVQHFRVDQEFSNAYNKWNEMGSPKAPTLSQKEILERAGQLQLYASPQWVNVFNKKLELKLNLSRQAVSFYYLTWD